MNVKSKYDDSDAVREPKKKYIWLGYGQNSQAGGGARGQPGWVWDTHTFDIILEKLGLKKKTKHRSEGEE